MNSVCSHAELKRPCRLRILQKEGSKERPKRKEKTALLSGVRQIRLEKNGGYWTGQEIGAEQTSELKTQAGGSSNGRQ